MSNEEKSYYFDDTSFRNCVTEYATQDNKIVEFIMSLKMACEGMSRKIFSFGSEKLLFKAKYNFDDNRWRVFIKK